jgi:ABC-type multidrug transport system ATPase subunit
MTIFVVPQDDIVLEDLTVRENFMFSAQMRLSKNMSFEWKEAVVHRVLELLDLTHVADSVVGSVEKRGISGGQRKRVNM